MRFSRLFSVGPVILAPLLPLVTADVNPQLVAQLKTAGTQLDRLALLPNDATDWTFDFTAQPGYSFSPASVVTANVASFPVSTPLSVFDT